MAQSSLKSKKNNNLLVVLFNLLIIYTEVQQVKIISA